MEGGRKEKFSVGESARMIWKKHPGQLLRLGFVHFFPRVLMGAVLYACAWLSGKEALSWLSYGALALAFLFFVFYLMPSRFFLGGRLRVLAGAAVEPKESYPVFLKAGFDRLGMGILWGLPFLAGLSLFLYGMEYLPYNELGKVLQKFVLFGEATGARGLMIVLLLLLLLLLLFIFGWRRDMALEYLPLAERKIAGKVRKAGKGKLLKNAMINVLLSLPAILGCAGVLIPYARENMRVSSNLLRTVQSLLQLMKTLLPLPQMMLLLLVAAVLYMPFFLYRKTRCAVLVRELAREIREGQDAA